MAGGYTSSRALGIPIGERGAAADGPHEEGRRVPSGEVPQQQSLAPRGLPFVYVRTGEAPTEESAGIVVEQRRGPGGWQVLVAVVESCAGGGRAVAVRWVDAGDVRSALP